MRPFLAPLAALLAGALGGCDFSPTLDIPLPDFEPALTVNGVLAADSTVEVEVKAALDPYTRDALERAFRVPDGVSAELFRDGEPVGALRLDSETCQENPFYVIPGDAPATFECGSFVSDVVTEPGRTYTLRVSALGFPDAEATVTVPDRVPASAVGGPTVESPLPNDGKRFDTQISVRFRDPPGRRQRYGLVVVGGPYTYRFTERGLCVDPECTEVRDTTYTVYENRRPVGYTTTDPVLLAAARVVPSTGISFIAFDDEAFDGQSRALDVRAQQFWYPSYNRDEPNSPVGVWLITADAETYGAYQLAWFSGGEDNPFAEPADLPSNVVGGYGLLGAVTITEALIE